MPEYQVEDLTKELLSEIETYWNELEYKLNSLLEKHPTYPYVAPEKILLTANDIQMVKFLISSLKQLLNGNE
jgi:hypothetical protein